MKGRPALYTPLLFGVVMILAGFSARFVRLMGGIGSDPFLSTTIMQLLVFLLPLAVYAIIRGAGFSSVLKFNGFSVRKLPFIAVMTLLMAFFTLFCRYMGIFWFRSAMTDTPSAVYFGAQTDSAILNFLCNILLPAILEEILCRGVLLTEYRSFGNGFAVCMSAAMFALLHFDPANLFYYFCLGLILGAVTVVSDSLIPALVMHTLCNLSYFYMREGALTYVRQAGKSALLPYLLFAATLFCFFLVFSRLEDLYRGESYDAMNQSRKELLEKELEKNREEPEPKKSFLPVFRDVWLSPTFLGVVAVYVLFAAKIF